MVVHELCLRYLSSYTFFLHKHYILCINANFAEVTCKYSYLVSTSRLSVSMTSFEDCFLTIFLFRFVHLHFTRLLLLLHNKAIILLFYLIFHVHSFFPPSRPFPVLANLLQLIPSLCCFPTSFFPSTDLTLPHFHSAYIITLSFPLSLLHFSFCQPSTLLTNTIPFLLPLLL